MFSLCNYLGIIEKNYTYLCFPRNLTWIVFKMIFWRERTDISCLGRVFAKNTRLETIKFHEPKVGVFISKCFFFQYITYDVRILFDECPYVSKYSLSYDFSKDFLNSRKSQVVCKRRYRFTDIYPDIQWKTNGHWQCGYISQFYQIKSN